MKGSVIAIAMAALVIGFGAGFALRPVLAPAGVSAAAAAGRSCPAAKSATASVIIFCSSVGVRSSKAGAAR